MRRFYSLFSSLTLALLLPGVLAFAQVTPAPVTLTPSATGALPLNLSPSVPPAFAPAAPGEDIADLRGIWVPDYQRHVWRAVIIIAAVLMVSGLAWWWWRWWKKRRPTLTLYQRAILRLQQCRELIADGNAKLFSGEVSDIVRGWLERRFAVPSTHQTTEEFFQAATEHAAGDLSPHLPALKDFLSYCDMAKFAKGELTIEQMNLMWASAENFIELTKPADGEAQPAEAGS